MSTLGGVRWQAANAALDRALDLTGEQRATWLAALRARDAGLAADVQALLDENDRVKAAHFLEDGPGDLPVTRTSEGAIAPAFPSGPRPLANGTVFGPYRIVRPLGRGGMGAVYAADEIDSGRRVALKVLAGPRQDERERERFEREGRLAASVNHPHCVFVFGAGEIADHPVIAMEVMAGTLADRLKTDGPLPPAVAVDAMLQLMAGLQAAGAAGILHRDVKPSNCFIDAQGVVKIGDFGISRSQRPTDETALSTRGRPAATPAYASPEQLRGAALDVRADIYSLGATLYELLTGQRPFDGADLMALLMAVANDTPTAPHLVTPAVPKGLSAVVLRCLAKRPEQRYADYDALAAALEPYSSTASTPATFGRRCLAGVIDSILILLASLPIHLWWGVDWLTLPPLLIVALLEVLYYTTCEGRWAATPGKAICGLMIVQDDGAPARGSQVIVRAVSYVVFPAAPLVALLLLSPVAAESLQLVMAIGKTTLLPIERVSRLTASPESLQVVLSAINILMLAVLFSTARRRNGYAGLHDLVSRTRVVERRGLTSRRTAPAVSAEAPRDVIARFGPFAVFGGSVPGMPAGWRPGFDERLRRSVWIREVPPGTPPISLARRGINRATRLRWLAGRREAEAAWDAFEAVPGVPLDHSVAAGLRTWADVRWWLLDLARECAAQSPDDRPPRRRDRVWILDAGGAKLIDDPAVDHAAAIAIPETPVATFLLDIARATRGSARTPPQGARSRSTLWPLRVHEFLERLTIVPDLDARSIAGALETLTPRRAVVTRGWRALSMAVPLLIPTMWALTLLVLSSTFTVMNAPDGPLPADVRIAARLLRELARADQGLIPLPARDREAIELALATRYRAALRDDAMFAGRLSFLGMTPRHRRLADVVLRRHPASASGPEAPTSPTVDALVSQATNRAPDPWYIPIGVSLAGLVAGVFCVAVTAPFNALLFRGGVMRLLGLELVTDDGRPASRIRVLARTALAWSPLLLLALLTLTGVAPAAVDGSVSFSSSPEVGSGARSIKANGADPFVSISSVRDVGRELGESAREAAPRTSYSLAALLVLLAGAIVAIVNPARGIQDRLAGTWIVPR